MKFGVSMMRGAAMVCALGAFAAGCGGEKGGGKPKSGEGEHPVASAPADKPAGGGVQQEQPPAPAPPEDKTVSRSVSFPEDRSLGKLKSYSPEQGAWVDLGDAKGTVSVPAGAGLTLIVSAEGVKDLSPLASMPPNTFRQLVLDELEIPEGELNNIENLAGMQKISLRAAQVSDAAVVALGSLLGLTEIDLAMTPITDEAIKPLVNLTQLETLDISATEVGDGAIPDITAIKSLRTLDPQRSKITPEGVEKIGEALPECSVVVR